MCVARGGRGGLGTALRTAKSKRPTRLEGDAGEIEELLVDMNPKEYTKGEPGEDITLELLLRVVADVGLVGFPNVGKSSLLLRKARELRSRTPPHPLVPISRFSHAAWAHRQARLTRASPEIANYPFTTLMPNLGVMQTTGDVVSDRIRTHERVVLPR